MRTCCEPDCDRPAESRRRCRKHYQRLIKSPEFIEASRPKADGSMADADIEHLYGDLLRVGFEAFARDPEYVVTMVERAVESRETRQVREHAETYQQRKHRDAMEADAKALGHKGRPLRYRERNQKIVNLYLLGVSPPELGRVFGMRHEAVRQVIYKHVR